MAWVCHYTSLTPDDIMKMKKWQFEVFTEQLAHIISVEKGMGKGD